jgi:uncharacterized protein YqjF (DUF2071 family)
MQGSQDMRENAAPPTHPASALCRAAQAVAGRLVSTFAEIAGPRLEAERLPPAGHRPWPPPATPWVLAQRWESILFAHWAVPAERLRPRIPDGLDVDEIEGTAWVGVTPFLLSGARIRGLPAAPGFGTFGEVNVRTYVTAGDKPGVFFLSLDAASALAVLGARVWYGLPYFLAAIDVRRDGPRVTFTSRRKRPGVPPAELAVGYAPAGPVHPPRPQSLVWSLTERYCLYTVGAGGRLARAEVHHAPWPLQPADVTIERQTLTAALELPLPDRPDLAHFSVGVDAVAWPPAPVTANEPGR